MQKKFFLFFIWLWPSMRCMTNLTPANTRQVTTNNGSSPWSFRVISRIIKVLLYLVISLLFKVTAAPNYRSQNTFISRISTDMVWWFYKPQSVKIIGQTEKSFQTDGRTQSPHHYTAYHRQPYINLKKTLSFSSFTFIQLKNIP